MFMLLILALVAGLVISLMPVILFVVGFILMIGLLTLIGRYFGSWCRY
jgi:hypothetical protein